MQGGIIEAGAKPIPGFSLSAMRQTLRGHLPKTLFKDKPRRGFLPSALGAGLFTLIAGGGWLLIEDYGAGAGANGAMEAQGGAPAQVAAAGR